MTAIAWDEANGWHNGESAKLTIVGGSTIKVVPLESPETGMKVSEIAEILCVDFFQVMRLANDLDAQGYNIFFADKTLTPNGIDRMARWHWDRRGVYTKPVK